VPNQALRCGRTTVDELVRSGALESVKIGKLRRTRIRDLHAYVNACPPQAAANRTSEA
jgi:excisionase family DNA binding protein